MRKPVNSEIDLIRAIFTKTNDILLEAKERDLFGNIIPKTAAEKAAAAAARKAAKAAAVPPAVVPPAAVPPAAVPPAPAVDLSFPNWNTIRGNLPPTNPKGNPWTHEEATQAMFTPANLNPNLTTPKQKAHIIDWYHANKPAEVVAGEIGDELGAEALAKLESQKAHGERLAAIVNPDPNIAAQAALTRATKTNQIQVGTEDLARSTADRPAAIAAQTAQTNTDRANAAAAQRTSASAIRVADAIRPGEEARQIAGAANTQANAASAIRVDTANRPGNEADAIAGAANTNANNASARNTQGLARDFADAKTARGRSSFGQENTIQGKEEENGRRRRDVIADKNAKIIADRAKPFYKREKFLTGVGALAGAALSFGSPMLLPMAAAGAMAGRWASSKLREDYQIILEQRLFEAANKKVMGRFALGCHDHYIGCILRRLFVFCGPR